MNFENRDTRYETIEYIFAVIVIAFVVGFGVYRTYIKFNIEMNMTATPVSITLEDHEFWKSGYYLLHKPNCSCKGEKRGD